MEVKFIDLQGTEYSVNVQPSSKLVVAKVALSTQYHLNVEKMYFCRKEFQLNDDSIITEEMMKDNGKIAIFNKAIFNERTFPSVPDAFRNLTRIPFPESVRDISREEEGYYGRNYYPPEARPYDYYIRDRIMRRHEENDSDYDDDDMDANGDDENLDDELFVNSLNIPEHLRRHILLRHYRNRAPYRERSMEEDNSQSVSTFLLFRGVDNFISPEEMNERSPNRRRYNPFGEQRRFGNYDYGDDPLRREVEILDQLADNFDGLPINEDLIDVPRNADLGDAPRNEEQRNPAAPDDDGSLAAVEAELTQGDRDAIDRIRRATGSLRREVLDMYIACERDEAATIRILQNG